MTSVLSTPGNDVPPSMDAGARTRPVRRMVLVAVGIVALVLIALATIHYLKVGRYLVSTDDAYVKADNTIVAPKVAGYVSKLEIADNQPVKAGQVLARIDDRDLRAALDQAVANEQAAEAAVANVDAQLTAQGSMIKQADASVAAASASLDLARRNDVRRRKMAETGYGSTEQADTAGADVTEQSAGIDRLHAVALASRQQVGVLHSQREMAVAQLARARAERHQTELNLSYATITAPVDGTVAARTVRVGQYVQAGTQLMAIVPLQQVYVIANYKETQLEHVFAGQRATISVDTFSGDKIEGYVDTLAPASGMEFSLLPADNATGNFTKIVQRIPVKIVFPVQAGLVGRLRPGMSVTTVIDTVTRGSGHSLAQSVH